MNDLRVRAAGAGEIVRPRRFWVAHSTSLDRREASMDDRQRYWFAARRNGRGWGWPLTWQGWVSYGVWFAAFLVLFPHLRVPERPVFALVVLVSMVIPLALICYWKGEPLRRSPPE